MTPALSRDYEPNRFTRSPYYPIRYVLRPPECVRAGSVVPTNVVLRRIFAGCHVRPLRLVLVWASRFVLLASSAGSAYASSHLSQPTSGARIQGLRSKSELFSLRLRPDPRPAASDRVLGALLRCGLRGDRLARGSRPRWVASLHARRPVTRRRGGHSAAHASSSRSVTTRTRVQRDCLHIATLRLAGLRPRLDTTRRRLVVLLGSRQPL